MPAFQCTACPESFPRKSQLDQHRQVEHQMCTTVNFFDGTVLSITRDTNTQLFTCPVCTVEFKRPKAIQAHARRDCRQKSKTRKVKRVVEVRHEDLSTPAVLRSLGLTFLHQARALLCQSCKYCVGRSPRQVQAHIMRAHSTRTSFKPDEKQLGDALKELNLASESDLMEYGSSEPILPIEGLPVRDGEMCLTCNYMVCCKRSMQRHLESHGTEAQSSSIHLQTFFVSTRTRFFVYRSRQITQRAESSDELGRELQDFRNFYSTAASDDVDERLLAPLLRQLHWHRKLPTYTERSSSELMNMCKISKESTLDLNVCTAVSYFFEKAIKLLDSVQYLARRYIIAGGLDLSNVPRGFGYVEDATRSYQRHMAKLIHMAAVCGDLSEKQLPVWKFSTSNCVERAAMKLHYLCGLDSFDAESEPVQNQVERVLEALYVSESDAAAAKSVDDFVSFSVYRYVVCASISGGELHRLKLLEVNSITSICAAFVYWARLYALVSIASQSPRPVEKILYYVRDGVPTSYNALAEIMKLGKHLSGPSEGQHPLIHWVDDAMTSLVCKTATVTKLELRNMAFTLETCVKDTLKRSILRGFTTDILQRELEHKTLVDEINAKADASWFMRRPENQLSLGPEDFLSFLASNDCYNSLRSDTYSGTWDEDRVKAWLRECDEFVDDLAILMHLTFGQPSRASEMTTFRLRDSHLEYRSVFAIRNRFSIIQVYHKSMNVTGKFKAIARFAPASLSADLLLYFHLVRPVQAYLYDVIFPHGERHGQLYLDYIFVKAGKRMSADQIRRSIAKGFSKFSEMKLDVSTYRHVSVALIDPHFRQQRLSDDLFDEQAGHSRETASTVYARADNDPSSLSRDQLHRFWVGSCKWHQFLGLSTENTPVERKRPVSSDLVNSSMDREGLSNQLFGLAAALTNLQTQFQTLHNDALSLSKSDRSSNRMPLPTIAPKDFASAKHVVERFTGSSTGSFLSVEQGIAISLLTSGPQKHRLIVLPTGGGKSILYMAHYIVNPRSVMTSVIVIPSVALLNESVLKARLHDLTSCKYSSDLNTSGKRFNLVFAAVEHIGQEDFREYLTLLKAREQLHTIFIDEAHLVLTSLSYRPQMVYVPLLTTFGVPIVLLSATVPVQMENDIKTMMRVDFETIRAQTNRPNISYRVDDVKEPQCDGIAVMKNYQAQFESSRNRCIAYCATRGEVDNMCQLYQAKTKCHASQFHAGMEPQQQAKSVAEWKCGKSMWMIATSAFGVGIDYSSVRVVLHVGSSWSLLNYAQGSGRAGRDGDSCLALTLTNRHYQGWLSKSVNEHARGDFNEMVEYLNGAECRRQKLQTKLDGYGFPCIADNSNELCDLCKDLEHEENKEGGLST